MFIGNRIKARNILFTFYYFDVIIFSKMDDITFSQMSKCSLTSQHLCRYLYSKRVRIRSEYPYDLPYESVFFYTGVGRVSVYVNWKLCL